MWETNERSTAVSAGGYTDSLRTRPFWHFLSWMVLISDLPIFKVVHGREYMSFYFTKFYTNRWLTHWWSTFVVSESNPQGVIVMFLDVNHITNLFQLECVLSHSFVRSNWKLFIRFMMIFPNFGEGGCLPTCKNTYSIQLNIVFF